MNELSKAARLGIETSFIDATGQRRAIDPSALQILMESIPDKPTHGLLRNPLICRDNTRPQAQLSEQTNFPVRWQMRNVKGAMATEGMAHGHALTLPPRPFDVYDLRLEDASGVLDETSVIFSPPHAFEGDFDRVWILAVQLYGVRSSRNWGIGDFTDLETLLRWASIIGAGGIGLNPLHALFDDHAGDRSPYSPNSRLFLNPLYIDVTRLPELGEEYAVEHAEEIELVRSVEFIDHVQVADIKLKALRRAFAAFKLSAAPSRKVNFDQFRRDSGERLFRFACFEVLRRKYPGPWWDWPSQWSSPNNTALEEFRNGADLPDIEYVEFVQWCAHEQLKACSDLADQLKLPIGLYLDVAVGVKADGFDAWNEQVAISHRLSVGAPPDLLNTAGQDWGLAGFNASGLEARLYQPFRDVLSASMRYAGAIRLDHVLGLNRLYLVPAGHLPNQGTYVQMPFEALLGVTALESVAHNCVVIGEDLGTVPDDFRERLADWGIWSYRVMMFERNHDGAFHPIEDYPRNSMVTFNTHDLPTFAGWQSGHDLELKLSLGIDPGESHEARIHASTMLDRVLDLAESGEDKFYSMLNYLAQTKSRILSVSTEDLFGVVDQPNIPGTIDEHPNWRRRLPVSLETWERHIDAIQLRRAMESRSTIHS